MTVVIGTLQLEIRFSEPQSLKEKRMLLKSLVTRIRSQFNVSIAEVDGMDLWQASVLAIACVGKEQKHVNQTLDYVANFVSESRDLEITRQQLEFL